MGPALCLQSVRGAAARGWSIFLQVYPMTLTAPIPLWLDLGPIPTLTTTPAIRRQILTDSGALVLLGDIAGFAAIFAGPPQQVTAADPPGHAATGPRHRASDDTRTAT